MQVFYLHSFSKDAALIFAGDRVVVVVIVVFVLEGARFEPWELLNKMFIRGGSAPRSNRTKKVPLVSYTFY